MKDAEAASLAASNKQLTLQLSQEMARAKTGEGQMARLQTQLVSALIPAQPPWQLRNTANKVKLRLPRGYVLSESTFLCTDRPYSSAHVLNLPAAVQAQSKQETERLQQQLADAQRNAATAASAADASIRDLNQQLQAAQSQLKAQQDTQQRAALEQHRQLQDAQLAADEAQHQLAEARKQLDAMRAQLLAAEDARNAAQQRAKLAEDQATAMSGKISTGSIDLCCQSAG